MIKSVTGRECKNIENEKKRNLIAKEIVVLFIDFKLNQLIHSLQHTISPTTQICVLSTYILSEFNTALWS